MIVAPSAPGNVMSCPSMLGSLAAIDNGLRATGDGDAAGEAAGDAAGEAAGLAAGLAAADGDATAAGLTAGDAAAAVVGLGGAVVAAGALVGCAAGWEQPSANNSVAVLLRPPVMFRTRRTRSRRDRWPAL